MYEGTKAKFESKCLFFPFCAVCIIHVYLKSRHDISQTTKTKRPRKQNRHKRLNTSQTYHFPQIMLFDLDHHSFSRRFCSGSRHHRITPIHGNMLILINRLVYIFTGKVEAKRHFFLLGLTRCEYRTDSFGPFFFVRGDIILGEPRSFTVCLLQEETVLALGDGQGRLALDGRLGYQIWLKISVHV